MAHSAHPIAALAIIFLAGLWLLAFEVYPRYCADLLRFRLRVIRDDLFDLGRSGSIAFDSPGYRNLRRSVSMATDHAHYLSFSRLVLFSYRSPGTLKERAEDSTILALRELQSRFESCVAGHLVRTTVVLLPAVIAPAFRRRIAAFASEQSIESALEPLCH